MTEAAVVPGSAVADRPAWLLPGGAAEPPPEGAPAAAEPAPARRRGLTRAGRAATAVGALAALFIGYEFGLTALVHDRAQPTLLATFQLHITSTTLDASSSALVEGAPVAILSIPAAGVNEVVVEGTTPEDLQSGPGHLRSTPLPGEFGNAVIAGRRTTYGAPFRDLDRLAAGDRLSVTTGQGTFAYRVVTVRRTASNDAGPLVGTTDSRLTLVTSNPAILPSGRLVVVAKLVGKPVALPSRASPRLAADDLGLTGDPAAALFALVWVAALGLVLAAFRWARRWPRSVRYMLAAPAVAACLVLLFASLDPVLPGTL